MQSQESLLWLYSSSSLHKNHPSGGGLTWKVSRRPLHAGTLCLPVSWQGRHEARSNAIPAWSCSSSTGCVEQCGLMVLFDPREAFSFFSWSTSRGSAATALLQMAEITQLLMELSGLMPWWGEVTWNGCSFTIADLVVELVWCLTSQQLLSFEGSMDLWEGKAGLVVHSQIWVLFLSF